MGVKRLKIKNELNYRRGSTAHHCSECDNYIADFEDISANGVFLGPQPRCKVIGLKTGRSYRVHPKNICDRYDNKKKLKRLRGW